MRSVVNGGHQVIKDVYLDLIDSMTKGTASALKTAKMIEHDHQLVSQVMLIANSAYYSIPGGVTGVKHALFVVGQTVVLEVILAESLKASLKGKTKPQKIKAIRDWSEQFQFASLVRAYVTFHEFDEKDSWYTAVLLNPRKIPKVDQSLPKSIQKWISNHQQQYDKVIDIVDKHYSDLVEANHSSAKKSDLKETGPEKPNWQSLANRYYDESKRRLETLLGKELYAEAIAA